TLYANDGDWVESLTALVEHPNGRLEILDCSVAASPVATPALALEPVLSAQEPLPGLTSR
ncbi:MAG: hypothetical protein LW854_14715, partial [Rubrivivax sp.]|nr:hypothetical protein [Rubrivivax sp.]